jgi:hypothetical protein
MKSVRCIHCGLINWADAEACKRCGNAPQSPAQEESGGWEPGSSYAREAGYVPGAGPASGTGYAPGGGYAPDGEVKKRTGLAVASLVIGILSLLTFSLLFVGGLTALILGVVALTRAGRQPQLYGGRGLAVGGIVTSALSLLIAVPLALILAIVIPNILASVRAANEASAIHSVREILLAEDQYKLTTGDGEYATMEELATSGLPEGPVVGGTKDGYQFELTVTDETCTVSAVPMMYGRSGGKSFYATCGETDIHYADHGGAAADSSDPLIDEPTYNGRRLFERDSGGR